MAFLFLAEETRRGVVKIYESSFVVLEIAVIEVHGLLLDVFIESLI